MNWVTKDTEKLPSDQIMKEKERDASATVTMADRKLSAIKWYENKPVVMLAVVHA